MENVLVTGGSHAEIPLIDAVRQMGYRCITTGTDEEGLGHRKSDIYEKGDYSDREFVLALAQKYHVRGIVAGCNDFAYLSAAYACEQLGLPGHDSVKTAECIHHKNRFRELGEKSGIPVPKFYCGETEQDLMDAAKLIGFPLLVKAVDLTGGKGVRICRNEADLRDAIQEVKKHSRQSAFLAEKMIIGENHGVSTLVLHGKVVFSFFDNEEYYLNPYLVSGAYAPTSLSAEIQREMVVQIEKLFDSIDLVNGLFHCQCIVTEEGVPYLIDPCRRSPGDLYLKLVEYATGIPYAKMIVRSELGMDIADDLKRYEKQNRLIARECIMGERNGTISGIRIADNLQERMMESMIWGAEGDLIEDYLKYKAGIVFLEFHSEREMEYEIGKLRENMRIVYGD